jgi:hypothetical protein
MSLKKTILRHWGRHVEKSFQVKIDKAHPYDWLYGEPEANKWYKLPVKNAVSADGSAFYTYIKKGASKNLAVYLMGGGVSYNQHTAKYPATMSAFMAGEIGLYCQNLGPLFETAVFLSFNNRGILSVDVPENKFNDWNVIFIAYATGDFHTGQNDLSYLDEKGNNKILRHQGYRNLFESMKIATPYFPNTEKLLILGNSAGAFAVPAVARDIMGFYPACSDVTVYSDSALLLSSEWKTAVRNVWKSPERIASVITSDNIVADWYRALVKEKGDGIRYLYSCSVKDEALAVYQNYMSNGKFSAGPAEYNTFKTYLKKHITELKEINPRVGIHINEFPNPQKSGNGTEHCISMCPRFFEPVKGGVSAMDWLWDAVNGKVYDSGLELLQEDQ